MNLNKLLSVGKSFFGMRNDRSPYELRQENLLPRFGHSREASAPIPIKPPGTKSSYTRSAVASAQSLFRTTFNPEPRETNPGRISVQGQFTLETVKVIRNDLRDADLELAPVTRKHLLQNEHGMDVPSSKTNQPKPSQTRSNTPLTPVGGAR